jgi:hypothetical protein
MNKFALIAVALAAAPGSNAAADVILPNNPNIFRCAADVLVGHPSDGVNAEVRTGLGRQQWANYAFTYYVTPPLGVPQDKPNGKRYWVLTYGSDVTDYADPSINEDLYPVYADANLDVWVGPGPNNLLQWHATTRSQIANLPYTGAYNLPAGVMVFGLCQAGCYTPEQEIRVGKSGLQSVVSAHDSGEKLVTTLTAGSTMDAPTYMTNRIARWTVDIAPASQPIVTLRTKSGGSLRVTLEHPLLTSDGVMKQAQTLVVGESLVREDGAPDRIVSMSTANEVTKTYNLRPTTNDLTSNILVAQGYLAGSARYQDEFSKYLNRALFRHQLVPVEVIPRSGATTTSR